jgi:hypothetical protein
LQVSSTNRIPALQKNEIRPTRRGKSSSETRPVARTASRTVAALARVKATSSTGSAPASWRWYEHTLMGFHRGTSCRVQVIRSVVSRIDGAGGNAYVPRDRYSLRMSFCVVPWSAARSAPCSSATATYIARSHIAVALMVIEVFMSARGMPSNRARMSPRWPTGTPTRPTSPTDMGSSES